MAQSDVNWSVGQAHLSRQCSSTCLYSLLEDFRLISLSNLCIASCIDMVVFLVGLYDGLMACPLSIHFFHHLLLNPSLGVTEAAA